MLAEVASPASGGNAPRHSRTRQNPGPTLHHPADYFVSENRWRWLNP